MKKFYPLFILGLLCAGQSMADISFTATGDNLGSGVGSGLTVATASVTGSLVVGTTFTANQGFYQAGQVKSANYVMTSTDSVILASGTANVVRIITLPSAASAGQQLTITKVDRSTATVLIQAPSPSLIASTTDQFRLYAPGQSVQLISDGTNWQPMGPMPVTPPFIGANADPNSAQTVTASTTYCNAVWTPTFLGITAIRINVGAQALQTQVAVYDSNGVVISTSAKTTLGTGAQTINLVGTAFLSPGTNWLCVGAESATTSITRQAASTAFEGSCAFGSGLPFPTSQTFPGCTASHLFSITGLVGGGVR